MWDETVAPAIAAMPTSSGASSAIARIKCFGVGESDLEAMLPDMIRREREPLVGITVQRRDDHAPHHGQRPRRVCLPGRDGTDRRANLATAGVLVFGEEDDELEDAVVRLLDERGESVAVAEWATDGLVCNGWRKPLRTAMCSQPALSFPAHRRRAYSWAVKSRPDQKPTKRPPPPSPLRCANRRRLRLGRGRVSRDRRRGPPSHGGRARRRRANRHVASGSRIRRQRTNQSIPARQPSVDHQATCGKAGAQPRATCTSANERVALFGSTSACGA